MVQRDEVDLSGAGPECIPEGFIEELRSEAEDEGDAVFFEPIGLIDEGFEGLTGFGGVLRGEEFVDDVVFDGVTDGLVFVDDANFEVLAGSFGKDGLGAGVDGSVVVDVLVSVVINEDAIEASGFDPIDVEFDGFWVGRIVGADEGLEVGGDFVCRPDLIGGFVHAPVPPEF